MTRAQSETSTWQRHAQTGSATVYQLPRGPLRGRRCEHEPDRAANVAVANIVFGSGWYHDEAIETERARKNHDEAPFARGLRFGPRNDNPAPNEKGVPCGTPFSFCIACDA